MDCLFTLGILLGINLLFFILLGSIIMLRRVEKENGQREAQAVASELGLELSPHSNTLAGVYKDRTIHLTITNILFPTICSTLAEIARIIEEIAK